MPEYVRALSNMNPLKWGFQSLFVWRWRNTCSDFDTFASQYGSEDYNLDSFWKSMCGFILVPGFFFYLSLLQIPSRMRRVSEDEPISRRNSSDRRASQDAKNAALAGPALPVSLRLHHGMIPCLGLVLDELA